MASNAPNTCRRLYLLLHDLVHGTGSLSAWSRCSSLLKLL